MEICYICFPTIHKYGTFHRLAVPVILRLKVAIKSYYFDYLSPLYANPMISCLALDAGPMDVVGSKNRNTNASKSVQNVFEEEIDEQLWKMDGKIQRKRDEKL